MREVPIGSEASLTFRVEESMQAAFDGRLIHPVLSTWALVHHLEWAARQVLEPAIEPHEEGVGVGVDVRHLGPAPVGAEVRVMAMAVRRAGNLLVCAVRATWGDRDVAQGRVFQAVLERSRLNSTRSAGPPALDGEE